MFVDPTGRRARRVHQMGRILVVPALGYMVALGSSLMGGPSLPSVLVPGQADDAETASYVEFRDGVVVTPVADDDAVAVPSAEEASSAPDDGDVTIRGVSSESDSATAEPDATADPAAEPSTSQRQETGTPGAKNRGRSKQAGGAARPDHAGGGAAKADGRGTEPKDKDKDKDSPADASTPAPGANRGNAPGE